MSKLETLSKFLECDVKDIKNENDYFLYKKDEYFEITYLVLTDEEADEAFKNYIKDIIMDIGLFAFTESAREYIVENFINNDYLKEIIKNDMYYYCMELKDDESENSDFNNRLEEEMAEYNCETIDDYITFLTNEWENNEPNYFINGYGENGFNDMLIDDIDNIVDIESICEYIKDIDGRGNSLASWDGVEDELDGYYIYRID